MVYSRDDDVIQKIPDNLIHTAPPYHRIASSADEIIIYLLTRLFLFFVIGEFFFTTKIHLMKKAIYKKIAIPPQDNCTVGAEYSII